MSEILSKQPEQKNEEKDRGDGEAVDWADLAEGEKKADWESLSEVEYNKETGEAEGSGETAEKVAKLKGWIDLDAIAAREDPEGLMAAEQEGETRRGRVEDCKIALAEKDGRYAEIDERREAVPAEIAEARHALEMFERKERRGVLSGMKQALGIGAKKRAELAARVEELTAERDKLWREKREIESERESLEQTIAGVDVDGAKREFLAKFETPLTPEEKKEGLDFEALAELTTEEYLKLWRRLNPFFLTHVTRQGIRDHNAMMYHSAGMGEFQEGMTGVLADGKVLRTPAEVRLGLGREVTEENVAKALDRMLYQEDADIEGKRARGMSDRAILDEMVNGLPVNTTIAAAEPWADKRAVHFAQLTALDDYYGGESGNEAFFVFPTDVIASQCRFGGHMQDGLTTADTRSERKWNDMFVWPKEKDITIDAGLTFLPKNMMVDAETGSKYATKVVEVDGKEVRVPEVDEEAVAKFTEWVSGLKAEDEAVRAFLEFGREHDATALREEALKAGVSERILDDVLDAQDDFQYSLGGFVNGGDLGQMWMIPQEELKKMTPEERRERSVKEFLGGRASTWKLATDAVPATDVASAVGAVRAEEYWEKHFQEHPEQRPAHVIYYDGDPSRAILTTLKGAGILEELPVRYVYGRAQGQEFTGKGDSHERDGDWLGFEENRVPDEKQDEAIQAEHAKFNEIARKMIAEHYGLAAE